MKKILISVVVGIVLIFIGSGIGSSGAKTTLNDKVVTAEKLDKEIANLKDKKTEAQDELEAQKKKNKEVYALVDKKDELEAKVEKAQSKLESTNGDIDTAKSSLEDVNSQIDSKQSELDKLTGQVTKAKGAPKVLQAGTYTAGTDFPTGRYKATPVGEGSNLATYDTSGGVDVNTILGSGGEPSYTFEIGDGYKLQTEATVKLTPIE
ncbi:hypothetical protein V7094_29170 [Priestia megaterium]|uniref:hypothetical protein n=1 Tax=Priestia megaterium TaxID=1404 RepID=UPI002FFF5A70